MKKLVLVGAIAGIGLLAWFFFGRGTTQAIQPISYGGGTTETGAGLSPMVEDGPTFVLQAPTTDSGMPPDVQYWAQEDTGQPAIKQDITKEKFPAGESQRLFYSVSPTETQDGYYEPFEGSLTGGTYGVGTVTAKGRFMPRYTTKGGKIVQVQPTQQQVAKAFGFYAPSFSLKNFGKK